MCVPLVVQHDGMFIALLLHARGLQYYGWVNTVSTQADFDRRRLGRHARASLPSSQRLKGGVHLASDGSEAMPKALEDAPFDIILMDVQLQGMVGYQATQALRNLNYPAPILALTGHTEAGERERCLRVGCDAYVGKPFKCEELYRTIDEFLV